ncbi:MAG: FAD-dependent tricarballylate dehydrogenase TcuA [Chloroflexi bacterium]|nr:FAD-dependent tricarballylate dehydrogenase TcuA [Chloroflexota bacterium]
MTGAGLPATVDVLVIGGGNAALCAALSARRRGRSVLLLEVAPRPFRGGNSRHTRDVRYLHDRISPYVTGTYGEDEFYDDLWRVTGGATDERLARLTIRSSADFLEWTQAQGVEWQRPLRGTLHLARTNMFMLGGGTGMMNSYYATAAHLGVQVVYEADVQDLDVSGGCVGAARVVLGGRELHTVTAQAVVVAAGGFEANLDWLREYWGAAADNFVVRGTPYNRGRLLRVLLDGGAQSVGDPSEFHCVAVDARAPRFDGGIVTRLDSVPFGIVVNRQAQRFYDEGEDFWPKRYAIWGGLAARQPGQTVYSIVDARVVDCYLPSVFPPFEAGSLRELAPRLGLDPQVLESTVGDYNAAVRPGRFDPAKLDDCHTEGLTPAKSHWALPLATPPFYAYALRPGITFTYMGLKVDEHARVLRADGRPFANLFAAGEIMAGNILGHGYLAGFGLTIGTVFGRIAGIGASDVATA